MLCSVGHLITQTCSPVSDATATALLDQVGLAFLALSTRQLREEYAGPALALRRDSDDVVVDVGFDEAGELDTAAVTTHLAGSNGFVKTWYDQSGIGNDFEITDPAAQPALLLNGLNNKPVLEFNGTSNYFNDKYSITHAATDWTMYAALESVTVGGSDHIFTTRRYGPNMDVGFMSLTNVSRLGYSLDNSFIHGPPMPAGPHSYGIVLEATDKAQIRLDGTAVSTDLPYTAHEMYSHARIGRAVGSIYYFEGVLGELLIWPRALSAAELQTLEANQTDYFIGA